MTTAQKRIRGPQLAVLVKFSKNLPFEEGLRRANDQNLVIASNQRIGKAMMGSDEWKSVEEALPCWTGTMTAYEKPGKPFRRTVEYVDSQTGYRWVFPVPEQYRREKNAILVAEHPEYTLEVEGQNRVVHATQVYLVRKFPAQADKWYKEDPKHGIPQGNQVSPDDPDARALHRAVVGAKVGPVSRFRYGFGGARAVIFGDCPSNVLGMAVEAAQVNE